jgi:hypothetical protein
MEGSVESSVLRSSVVWETLARDLNRSASIPRLFVHQDAEAFLKKLAPADLRAIAIRALQLPQQELLRI